MGTEPAGDSQGLPPRLPGHGADHRGGHGGAAGLLRGPRGPRRGRSPDRPDDGRVRIAAYGDRDVGCWRQAWTAVTAEPSGAARPAGAATRLFLVMANHYTL